MELIRADEPAFNNVIEPYPVGAEQPAWVALFRGGNMAAFTDNRWRVRLFLPGQTPQTAYADAYPVVRHVLNSLRPTWGELHL